MHKYIVHLVGLEGDFAVAKSVYYRCPGQSQGRYIRKLWMVDGATTQKREAEA